MALISTRGGDRLSASQAILRGLARDGGLFVPDRFPHFSLADIEGMARMGYQARALRVLGALLDDYHQVELADAVHQAYRRFDDARVAPLVPLGDGAHVLELFHGPTLAFKDVALQLLPHLTRLAMDKHDESRELFVLVATSGDTGKAALEGFADVPGTRCAVFFPEVGVSMAQRLQMTTQTGDNTHVFAVRGNFDDAQNGVKRIFSDPGFAAEMDRQHRMLSSANSINFGRLAPQVVYYFSAYADLIAQGVVQPGQPVHFAVPTGNFGNILAAAYAQRMGLPVGKLLCASNHNNVLADFLDTGVYNKDRPFHQTISPSMDILISSNLERLLFELCGRDSAQVSAWMASLQQQGRYDIGVERLTGLKAQFVGSWADDDTTRDTIRDVWRKHRYVMDPHTAVAAHALFSYQRRTGDRTPAVIASTASPFKFGRDVAAALVGAELLAGLDDFACCEKLAALTGLAVPPQIAALPTLPIRHTGVTDPSAMEGALLAALDNAPC